MALFLGGSHVSPAFGDAISVNVHNQSKTITPTKSVQTLVPDPGYTGMSQVTVESIPSSYIVPSGTLSISANGGYSASAYASVSVHLPYYEIYQSFARVSTIYSSISQISEYCDSFSRIPACQFAARIFSGNFTFNNASYIGDFAFSPINTGGTTTGGTSTYFSFPEVLSIGAAFWNNYSLRTIDMPKLSLISTYEGAFAGCTGLTFINFSNLKEIKGNYTFANCYYLSSINLPSLTSINGHYTFYYCQRLINVNLPALTSINGNDTFRNCYSLTSINLPELTTLINTSNMFGRCSQLSLVNFPKLTLISSSAQYMFSGCSNLESINLPNLENINYVQYMFSGCSNLESINLPNLENINYAYGMFYKCINLSIVSLPALTSVSAVDYMFGYCSKLESLYLTGPNVLSINTSYIFYDTPINYSSYLGYFGSIYVPSSLLTQYQTAAYWNVYSSRFVGV